jgi:hypothetical protein
MYAFNRRLQGKEIFGMPVVGAVGLLATLIFAVFSLLMPWGLKLFTIPLAVIGGLVAFLGFYLGEDLPFLPVMILGRITERRRITSESGTKQ